MPPSHMKTWCPALTSVTQPTGATPVPVDVLVVVVEVVAPEVAALVVPAPPAPPEVLEVVLVLGVPSVPPQPAVSASAAAVTIVVRWLDVMAVSISRSPEMPSRIDGAGHVAETTTSPTLPDRGAES